VIDRRTTGALTVLSLVLVVLLVVVDLENASPGPLSATHAQIPELLERDGCASCHGSQEGDLRDACLVCHTEIGQQLGGRFGFHGLLDDGPNCARCHLEHEGHDFDLVSPQVFALAGVLDRDAYEHTGLAFDLHGLHDALSCNDCHAHSDLDVLPVGFQRFLGESQACIDCHEDPHGAAMENDCASCHSQDVAFGVLPDYEHDPIFVLTGSHEGVGCSSCHEPESPFSIENSGKLPLGTSRECADCHDHTHAESFLRATAERANVSTTETCVVCHTPVPAGFRFGQSSMTREAHASTGFPLEDPHREVACDACHDPALARPLRFPGRDAQDCKACHTDPHAGQFAHPVERGQTCVDCHGTGAFVAHLFTDARHAAAGFVLDGAHASADCAQCHQVDKGVRIFRDTPQSCAACHEDVHAGRFESSGGSTDCAACHGTNAFQPVLEGAFDHGQHTGVALRGAHTDAACAACHKPETAVLGRTLGRVALAFPGPAERCDTCHTDVHEGRFLVDPTTGQRSDCADCHGEDSFGAPHHDAFVHGPWTGFELEGAHLAAECATCHVPTPLPDVLGRRFGRVRDLFPGDPETCATCHTDPHGGVFSQRGAQPGFDCSHCHQTSDFHTTITGTFDHAAMTGFALDGSHGALDCTACHPLGRPDRQGRTFGRALGSNCADCHRDPHLGQFRVEGRSDCARCHSVDHAFTPTIFDHDRGSDFPLDATHAKLDCAACHTPWTNQKGLESIRYRPIAHDCADCHLPGTGGGR
tara:strand:+ start:801 stop:3080 length:2280 start_codon:yes stop_codon:yes gene_type:complete